MAEEAWQSLNTLLENIPIWTSDLENILNIAVERQQQILFENQPADENDDPPIDSCHDQSPEQKSSSVRSNYSTAGRSGQRAIKSVGAVPVESEQLPTTVQMQRPHMTTSDELRLAQRKRKTASVCSDGEEAGPYKYRSRGLAVIYYDGGTQNRFVEVVDAISSSRNSLRKGKKAARLEMITPKVHCRAKSGTEVEAVLGIPELRFRSARQAAGKDGTECFDKIDSSLDRAQTMCERAAHQVLRDGDCAVEIKHAKQHFTEASCLADSELVVWRQRAEQEDEGRKGAVAGVGKKLSSFDDKKSGKKDIPPGLLPALPAMPLEVDDCDSEEEDVGVLPLDMTTIGESYADRRCTLVH